MRGTFIVGKMTFAIPALALLLQACIPASGGDYRIPSARAKPSLKQPQIVPESAPLGDTPNWQPAVVEQNVQPASGGAYTVQPGDTLYKVSRETGASVSDIAAANNLAEPYPLRVGQQLLIPTGLYHTVNAGETGIAIARAYGLRWADLVLLNRLEEPYVLKIGQRLRLPDGTGPATEVASVSPEERASRFSLNIDDIVTGGEPATQPDAAVAPNGLSFATPISRPASFTGNFIWPLSGQIISRFGSKGGGKVNDGINIGAVTGAPVGAAGDGVVVYSGNEIDVFGGLVLVDHGGGWITAYGHLGTLQVGRGDRVVAGQPLGTVGETGYVNTPQLHFEIRKDRKPLDPATKLPQV